MSDRFPIWPNVRIPIGARLRIFSDVLASMEKVTSGAPIMEKRKRKRLWRENMR